MKLCIASKECWDPIMLITGLSLSVHMLCPICKSKMIFIKCSEHRCHHWTPHMMATIVDKHAMVTLMIHMNHHGVDQHAKQ